MAAMAVAVTGDVGAGKSTASRLLRELSGGAILDADAVAKDVWSRKDVIEAAVKQWGGGILDGGGNIVPHVVAARIFSSDREYRWCCGLIHPLVMKELGHSVMELVPSQWAIVEVPLLFEVGRPKWVDAVVFVTAPWEERAKRCYEQRGWTKEELKRREKFFLPAEERMRLSDFVIDNAKGLKELEVKIRKIINKLSIKGRGGGE